MGIYDILKGKKEGEKPGMPEGKKVSAENEEGFRLLCESLAKDFRGMMRLYSKTPGKLYNAALLLEDGSIAGASFEDVDFKRIYKREDAINRVREKLSGTAGDLELYSFSDADVETVKKNNKEVLLKANVPFSGLGMKIRLHLGKGPKDDGGPSFSADNLNVRQLEVGSGFNFADFARGLQINFKEAPIKPAAPTKPDKHLEEAADKEIDERLAPSSEGNNKKLAVGGLKGDRLAELKKKRQQENLELMKRISHITEKKPEEAAVKDTVKVETSIDRLYQLVQKFRRLKIDDDLASKLGVGRPQIESWALILEEHNLVELHYPAIGEPEIRKIEGKR